MSAEDVVAMCATAGHPPTGERVMVQESARPVSVSCECGQVSWVPLVVPVQDDEL